MLQASERPENERRDGARPWPAYGRRRLARDHWAEELPEGAFKRELAGARTKAVWSDECGVGPLRLPGVFYAKVCGER